MSKGEKGMGVPLARDVRRQDPPERHVPTGRKRGGLFVVYAYVWHGDCNWDVDDAVPADNWYMVGGADAVGKAIREGHDWEAHGLPGLSWEQAQELKRELRRKHGNQGDPDNRGTRGPGATAQGSAREG